MYKIRSQIIQRRQEAGPILPPAGSAAWMRKKQQQRQAPRRTAEEKALQIRLDLEAKQAQRGVNRSLSPGETLSAPIPAPPLAGLRRSPRN